MISMMLGVESRRAHAVSGERVAVRRQVRASFRRVGEKRFVLARLGFRLLLGRDWRAAVLGFTFLKAVDDHVDADPDRERALSWFAERRKRLREAYQGREPAPDRSEPEAVRRIDADGIAFARYDRAHGSPLRSWFEEELDVIEGDVADRGTAMAKLEDLEVWAVRAGRPIVLGMGYFIAPGVTLAPAYVDLASRAYLVADSLVDLKQDLELDVIKVPKDAIEKYGIQTRTNATGGMRIRFPDPGIDRWLEEYGRTVLGYMEATLEAMCDVPSLKTRVLHRMMLNQKRARLRKFLAKRGIRVEVA